MNSSIPLAGTSLPSLSLLVFNYHLSITPIRVLLVEEMVHVFGFKPIWMLIGELDATDRDYLKVLANPAMQMFLQAMQRMASFYRR